MPAAAVLLALALTLLAVPAAAQTAAPELRALRATVAPRLDGVLDDAAWTGQPVGPEQWVSYNPLRGEPGQLRTRVWVAYDDEAIYFAFRCFDADPSGIRTTITRRDNIWNDDWVAVSLDSSRAGQVAYHMFVNPSGIQMDALQTSSGEDTAADWTWQTAGAVDDEGYVVEMRVPLESIRFKGGDDVRMNVLFMRRNSRMGISWAWPEMAPGKWVFESNVPVVFDRLQQPLLLEVIPSATVSSNQARLTPGGAWGSASARSDFGASIKYGITSTMTLDATVNPDFSQVESDAFQVEVNERFPVFFSEKRPFFMEGLGLFNLAGQGGDATMRTAVHTRRIIEPSVGTKLTGTAGRQTYAFLAAADESLDGEAQKFFTIGRVQRNYGQAQYIGGLFTDTEYRGSHNRVAAADFEMRGSDAFKYRGALMYSQSESLDGRDTSGAGAHLGYDYNTRRFNIAGHLEHFDRGFQMDTAFINRVGLTRTWQYGEVQFYPDQGRYPWLKRVAPFVWGVAAEDRVQDGTETLVMPGVRFNFTRQGYLRLDMSRGHETFAGRRFDVGRRYMDGNMQIFRWLNVGGSLNVGDAIFYDPVSPQGGTNTRRRIRVNLQPSSKLNHEIEYNFVKFVNDAGDRLFDVHVANVKNTYQFSPRFFVRALAQYDSSRRRVLGDFLASYELTPGTVVHLGYGTLVESEDRTRPYEATSRALFFKASYLARF
ncbi:MAG: DUF5916 domain-containing protein [Vicinamibacterales bacterium]